MFGQKRSLTTFCSQGTLARLFIFVIFLFFPLLTVSVSSLKCLNIDQASVTRHLLEISGDVFVCNEKDCNRHE